MTLREMRMRGAFVFLALLLSGPILAADAPELAKEEAAIRDFVQAYHQATSSGGRSAVIKMIDSARLTKECREQMGVELGFFARVAFRMKITSRLANQMRLISTNVHRLEPRQIEIDADGLQATVLVRFVRETGDCFYIRFWLAKGDAGWKWYDFEDHALGGRASELVGLVFQELIGSNLPANQMDLSWFAKVQEAMYANDVYTAGELLRAVEDQELPPTVDAIRSMLMAVVNLAEVNPAEAMENIDRAQQLRPDLPILPYLRGLAHNELGQPELALTEAQRYIDQVGVDPDALLLIGTAQQQLGRVPEAIAAFRKALDDLPDSVDNLLALSQVLPEEEKHEIVTRFLAMPNAASQFETIADTLLTNADGKLLESLARAWRDRAPEDPNGFYYLAQGLVLQEKHDEAAEIVKAAFPLVKDDEIERDYYYQLYINCMLTLGKGQEAYESFEDKPTGFRLIMADLLDREDQSQLLTLVEIHRSQFPSDPWAPYYEGDFYYYQEKYAEADDAYAKAEALEPDEDLKEMIRYSRVSCWFEMGKGLEAYDKFEPKEDTFAELAYSFYREKKPTELRTLMEKHEAATGASEDMPRWRIYLAFLEQDYTETLRLIDQEARDADEYEIYGLYEFEDVRFRALLRLKRFEEALEVAGENEFWQLIVAAARRDQDRVAELLPKLIADGYDSDVFLADDDLGPVLKSEAFRELREKHLTEPATEDSAVEEM